MNDRRRHDVVVTGLGPWTAVGVGVDAYWNALLTGRGGVVRLPFEWADRRGFRTRIGAPVADPEPVSFDATAREAALLDPATRLALAASKLALEHAGLALRPRDDARRTLDVDGVDPARAGVVLGTGIGGLATIETSHARYVLEEPLTGPLRYSLPMLIANALPAQVAIKFGLKGECKTVVTACAAGTMAIGDALRLLRNDELDVVLAGGVDRTLSTPGGYGLAGFELLKTMSTRNDEPERASRPFDAGRDGFVLGEGAGVLILEREAHARARGAAIHARVLGYGATCDAHSMMQLEPSGDQMVRAMELAIRDAGIAYQDVGYVNAHGTATRQNDPMEASALHRVFGRRVRDVLVNSTKALLGHSIGAAGGIEAITTALSLARGVVHRCVNLERPDPECDLALPRENARLAAPAALSNSFGFGGHNACLVLGR